MATEDKRIDQLDQVSVMDLTSLMVMQQGSNARKVTLDQLLNYLRGQIDAGNAVLFVSQTLSDTQKKQARANIGAAGAGDIPTGVVLYTAQSLTEEQQLQARTNIGAAAIGEGGGSIEGAVLFVTQDLTDEQKEQARKNIHCGSVGNPSGCVATGEYSSAEGYNTKAEGFCVHTEGQSTVAKNNMSHAEGHATEALESCCHSEGVLSVAKGYVAHAEGNQTIAAGVCQHVQGRLNIEDASPDIWTKSKYLHIVGNGYEEWVNGVRKTVRRNAHTLDWDGNAWYAGSVEGTAMILKSPGGKRFSITVNDSGALTAEEIV